MGRRRRYALIGLAGLGLVLAGAVTYAFATISLEISFSRASAAHQVARTQFLEDLPDKACLRVEDILAAVQARGWEMRAEPAFGWCVAPTTVAAWQRVTVEPVLPFSTDDENAQMFAFDEKGCAIDWTYAVGARSTCPD